MPIPLKVNQMRYVALLLCVFLFSAMCILSPKAAWAQGSEVDHAISKHLYQRAADLYKKQEFLKSFFNWQKSDIKKSIFAFTNLF